MKAVDNFSKYSSLREDYPYFIYESYHIDRDDNNIKISFKFNLGGKYFFHPGYNIPVNNAFIQERIQSFIDSPMAHKLVFHIGLIEMISYWKTACPPTILIKPHKLREGQISWLKEVFYQGLGEFFYLNGISADQKNFVKLVSSGNSLPKTFSIDQRDAYIIPIGGGKDSAVTLELLKKTGTVLPFVINPRPATDRSVEVAGIGSSIIFNRSLDPLLIALNNKGFLNGHTPFSALLAFNSLLAAYLTGYKNIALSNESSANEATIPGTEINHQYSKSFIFESGFRKYVSEFISPDLNYFSLMRPLSELQIARIFSGLSNYHDIFRSCNVGSKTDQWCGSCPKCLFTWIILSPFISQEKLKAIFGKKLLEDESLIPILEELTGLSDIKPFECVGTIDEVNLALGYLASQTDPDDRPALLKQYMNHQDGDYSPENFHKLFSITDPHHHLSSEEMELILNALR